MKFKMGGTIEFNIMARQYESVKATAVFEIEEEGEFTDDQLEVLNIKINKQLQEQLRKKVGIALKSQKVTKDKLESIMNMPDAEL